ncbi:hypothetical protein P171DRAFT_490584 [Karstenula rhodostoma CBS 690.94]|uniref:Uncharacterized protein n=1 Tax=Karstenula rhodostoma CBS 690.94 TaxID=1392251 RepID=A0A9P4P687_9PLEO|nr:hypothetical protein P171DRAFT_490584 [Karstenula rhodostoma CBS 690.94]
MDHELIQLLSKSFLGFARVSLDHLSFESVRKQHREESSKATARLLRVFELEGCERDKVENFVDALIGTNVFRDAIFPNDISLFQKAQDVQSLRLQQPLECLNGMHRIAAARKHLDPNDRWWTVRLLIKEGGSDVPYSRLELIHYLNHMTNIWRRLTIGTIAQSVDDVTVKSLELRAPGVSRVDLQDITILMSEGKIFSMASATQRSQVLEIVKDLRFIIPSLRTFFENMKYLEPCSQILKRLLDNSEKRSLEVSFRARYFPRDYVVTQCSEKSLAKTFTTLPPPLRVSWGRKIGYVQLWFFCLRNFPEMTDLKPKLDSRGQKIQRKQNKALWHRLATLAWRLGFDTEEIRRLKNEQPERAQAQEFLKSVRPCYEDTATFDSCVDSIASVLRTIEQDTVTMGTGDLTGLCRYPLNKRCGRPHYDDHERDKGHLFLPLMWHELTQEREKADVTSLFVKQDFVQTFFGQHLSEPIDLSGSPYEDLVAETFTPSLPASEGAMAKLVDELEEAKNRIHQLVIEKDNLETQTTSAETLGQELQAANYQIEHLKSVQSNFENQVARTDEEMSSLKQQLSIFETSQSEQLNQDRRLKSIIDERDGFIKQLEAQIRVQTEELAISKARQELQERDLTGIRHEVKEKDRLIKSLEAQVQAQAEEFTVREVRQERYDLDLANLQCEIEEKDVKIASLESELGEAKNAYLSYRASRLYKEVLVEGDFLSRWNSMDSWEKLTFGPITDWERRQTARSIYEMKTQDTENINIVHIFIMDGFRSVRYRVPIPVYKVFRDAIPPDFVFCVTQPGEGSYTFKIITEERDKIEMEDVCKSHGTCYLAEKAVLEEWRRYAQGKRRLGHGGIEPLQRTKR